MQNATLKENLELKVVKDYLKQQETMKCKGRNEKECTHIHNIRKKKFLESLMN
jgi:hypothetical protein